MDLHNLPCFLPGHFRAVLRDVGLVLHRDRPSLKNFLTLFDCQKGPQFWPSEWHACKWVRVGFVSSCSAQIRWMLMEKPAASLAQLFPCHVPPVADQPQEAVFSGDHAEHAEDGEWQRSTSTTSSQSERAEQLLQNQHKSLASEDTKKKRAQKPSHMRRNIR